MAEKQFRQVLRPHCLQPLDNQPEHAQRAEEAATRRRIYPCRRCRQAVKPQAGKSLHASEKIYRTGFQRQTGAIRRPYQKCRLDAFLVTSAASTSWLLNLRSNALPYTPVFRAYVLVEKNGAYKVFAEIPITKPRCRSQSLPKFCPVMPNSAPTSVQRPPPSPVLHRSLPTRPMPLPP